MGKRKPVVPVEDENSTEDMEHGQESVHQDEEDSGRGLLAAVTAHVHEQEEEDEEHDDDDEDGPRIGERESGSRCARLRANNILYERRPTTSCFGRGI